MKYMIVDVKQCLRAIAANQRCLLPNDVRPNKNTRNSGYMPCQSVGCFDTYM